MVGGKKQKLFFAYFIAYHMGIKICICIVRKYGAGMTFFLFIEGEGCRVKPCRDIKFK